MTCTDERASRRLEPATVDFRRSVTRVYRVLECTTCTVVVTRRTRNNVSLVRGLKKTRPAESRRGLLESACSLIVTPARKHTVRKSIAFDDSFTKTCFFLLLLLSHVYAVLSLLRRVTCYSRATGELKDDSIRRFRPIDHRDWLTQSAGFKMFDYLCVRVQKFSSPG